MDFQIDWAKSSLADLHDLVRYIARDNPSAATRFGEAIISKADILRSFPLIGRIVPEFNSPSLREMILSPYRIVYEVNEEKATISILRIWHSARGVPQLKIE